MCISLRSMPTIARSEDPEYRRPRRKIVNRLPHHHSPIMRLAITRFNSTPINANSLHLMLHFTLHHLPVYTTFSSTECVYENRRWSYRWDEIPRLGSPLSPLSRGKFAVGMENHLWGSRWSERTTPFPSKRTVASWRYSRDTLYVVLEFPGTIIRGSLHGTSCECTSVWN